MDVKFSEQRVPSVVLITVDFKQCMRAKFLVALGCCKGPTCTLECKQTLLAAIGTLDGSCCDQLGMGADAAQQCHIAMKTHCATHEAGCCGDVPQFL